MSENFVARSSVSYILRSTATDSDILDTFFLPPSIKRVNRVRGRGYWVGRRSPWPRRRCTRNTTRPPVAEAPGAQRRVLELYEFLTTAFVTFACNIRRKKSGTSRIESRGGGRFGRRCCRVPGSAVHRGRPVSQTARAGLPLRRCFRLLHEPPLRSGILLCLRTCGAFSMRR